MGKIFIVILLSFTFAVLSGGIHVKIKEEKKNAKISDSGSGIYEPPCCDGSGYEPPGTVLSEVPLNRPSAGDSVVDSTFGTTITALPDGARNTYSQLQVWSYDNRYMITVTPEDGYHVRNAETFSVICKITRSFPRWIPRTHKVITIDNEPGRIFSYNVDTGTEEVLMQLPEYQYITSSKSYEELSRDGQWVSLYITNDGKGNSRLLTVNLFEKRIGMNRRLQDMCAPDPEWGLLEPDWIGISPNGSYAVIQWVRDGDCLCCGLEIYDIETGEFVRRLHTHHSHSDLGLAADGREILVSFENAHPDNNNEPAIVLYWLDGSPKEYIRMVPWYRADHVSCQGPPGVWLVTAGNDEGNPLLKGELYIIYQDGSLRRIAHHRSNSCRYWAQPKATLSIDGTRIAFSSDWRETCLQDGGFVIHNLDIVPNTTPRIHINRSALTFGSTNTSTTGNQSFLISNTGTGTLNWTITIDDDVSWLVCSPESGTGSGEVLVSVYPSGLTAGTYTSTITVTDPDAVNSPQGVNVTLNIYQPGQDEVPFGTFETPMDGSTVMGSLPITGWVLDDIAVENVKIYRQKEGQAIYIGDAVFVEGARADVESAFPGYPNNYKAGWGYMMLTNFLPNGGNGIFKIRAIAADTEGHRVTLGTKTIICDNANAKKPFGAIDTPTQGGAAAGSSFINWGWALTPMPNRIPTDGSTIDVFVDGVNLGHPSYNIYREDIAGLFPGYSNTNGAVGYFYLDTTSYENGVHTIQWTVADNAGNADGIGSRYFSIQNSETAAASKKAAVFNVQRSMFNVNPDQIPINDSFPVWIKKGYNPNDEPLVVYPDGEGIITIEIKELERLEIRFNNDFATDESSTGSSTLNIEPRTLNISPLPIGSTLDRGKGIFYWQPGPGFFGKYCFVFVKKKQIGGFTKKALHITIVPRFL